MTHDPAQQTICPHCDPYPNHPWHLEERINRFFSPLDRLAALLHRLLLTHRPKLYTTVARIATRLFFRVLMWLRILQPVPLTGDEVDVYNRTLIVVRAARRRGITISNLRLGPKRMSTNFYIMGSDSNAFIFEGLPHLDIADTSPAVTGNKIAFKQLLQSHAVPVPEGRSFHDTNDALAYGRMLGFPLVVKPQKGSLSKHTTCNIRSLNDLREGIHIAKILCPSVIVERHIPGNLYRATLVDNTLIACCHKEPANVVGDGVHTIHELIERKNKRPERGATHQKNTTLHVIPTSQRTRALLQQQNLDFESIVPKGKTVYLHDKIALAHGADIHDVTDDVHDDNKHLFERIAHIAHMPILGIDIICRDIAKPHTVQEFGVLEGNSIPYIDMHHEPVTGTPRDVAEAVVALIARNRGF